MGRPASFERDSVVADAKAAFWQHGYAGTAMSDIEEVTGLSRSSLYLAFGPKRDLFQGVLTDYVDRSVDRILRPLEADGAGLQQAAGFFANLAEAFSDPSSRRGCLMVNSIVELAGRDPQFTEEAERFLDRLHRAFHHALHAAAGVGAIDRRSVERRAHMLAAAAVGAWVLVRASPAAASRHCRAVASEVRSWRLPRRGNPRR